MRPPRPSRTAPARRRGVAPAGVGELGHDVVRPLDQGRARPQERVAALRRQRAGPPRHRQHRSPQLQGEVGRDQRARAPPGLDHDHRLRQARDDAVARREAPGRRGRAGPVLGQQRAALGDPRRQPAVAARVGHVHARPEHRDREPAAVQRALVGRGVDAVGQAAHDDRPPLGQSGRERAGERPPLRRRPAAADDRHDRGPGQRRRHRLDRPPREEPERRVVELVEASRRSAGRSRPDGRCRRPRGRAGARARRSAARAASAASSSAPVAPRARPSASRPARHSAAGPPARRAARWRSRPRTCASQASPSGQSGAPVTRRRRRSDAGTR